MLSKREFGEHVLDLMWNRAAAEELLRSSMSDRKVLDTLRQRAKTQGLALLVDEETVATWRHSPSREVFPERA